MDGMILPNAYWFLMWMGLLLKTRHSGRVEKFAHSCEFVNQYPRNLKNCFLSLGLGSPRGEVFTISIQRNLNQHIHLFKPAICMPKSFGYRRLILDFKALAELLHLLVYYLTRLFITSDFSPFRNYTTKCLRTKRELVFR